MIAHLMETIKEKYSFTHHSDNFTNIRINKLQFYSRKIQVNEWVFSESFVYYFEDFPANLCAYANVDYITIKGIKLK